MTQPNEMVIMNASFVNEGSNPIPFQKRLSAHTPRPIQPASASAMCREPLRPNPAHSHVHDNLIIDEKGRIGRICNSVYQFSALENNHVFVSEEEAGMTPGEYILPDNSHARQVLPPFENIPLEKIGRY